MPYGLTTKQLESINSIFQRFPEIESAVIYGSRAKGNFKNASDIDITIKGRQLDLGVLSRVDIALDDLLLPYKFDISIIIKLITRDCSITLNELANRCFRQ